jgi:hypothetical protein
MEAARPCEISATIEEFTHLHGVTSQNTLVVLCVTYMHIADPCGRAVWGVGLRPVEW